jgi:seryl-tRNA synthetase
MGQARTRSDPEVTLFPFLSILVCIIGALMFLILVLTLAQGMLGDRRDVAEVARAREADQLLREAAERDRELQKWSTEKEKGDALHAELGTKRERFVVLTQKIEGTEDEKRKIEFEQAAAQKELENMLLQIEMIKSEQGPIRAEVEKLKAQLAARKATLDAKPRLVVRGSGSGAVASSTPLFFVECNATGIVIHHPAGPQHLSTGSIGLDQNYDDFLRHVASTPKAMVVFLLREDGLNSYNRAAGWAESRFAVRHGKLPLPGQGEVDLSLFQAPKPATPPAP